MIYGCGVGGEIEEGPSCRNRGKKKKKKRKKKNSRCRGPGMCRRTIRFLETRRLAKRTPSHGGGRSEPPTLMGGKKRGTNGEKL